VVLKPGWLNRQFDQVSKNVDSWPDWMKRAAGFEDESAGSPRLQNAGKQEESCHEDGAKKQQALHLT
jgi:hypothetical protein